MQQAQVLMLVPRSLWLSPFSFLFHRPTWCMALVRRPGHPAILSPPAKPSKSVVVVLENGTPIITYVGGG